MSRPLSVIQLSVQLAGAVDLCVAVSPVGGVRIGSWGLIIRGRPGLVRYWMFRLVWLGARIMGLAIKAAAATLACIRSWMDDSWLAYSEILADDPHKETAGLWQRA